MDTLRQVFKTLVDSLLDLTLSELSLKSIGILITNQDGEVPEEK